MSSFVDASMGSATLNPAKMSSNVESFIEDHKLRADNDPSAPPLTTSEITPTKAEDLLLVPYPLWVQVIDDLSAMSIIANEFAISEN